MDLDHIPPYYIDVLNWWEYEEYVKRLNDRIERENKQHKESQKSQPDYSKNVPNVNSMMNKLGNYKP